MIPNYPFHTTVEVRFSDTDAMGHCNNANYFSFMEQGRVAFFKELSPSSTLKSAFEVFPFILGHIQCSFRKPSYCGDLLNVHLGVSKIGTKSFTLAYQIINKDSGELIAEGDSVLVMFDYQTNQTQLVPNELIQLLKNYQKQD